MQLRTRFFLLLWSISLAAIGQTTLPTSWDFASTPSSLPTGWTTNTTASYSSGLPDNSGGTSRAGKLQATGHHFTIHFFDEPGQVAYNLRAYSSNGANFTGTFRVEESENGTTWSTMDTYNDNAFGNSWTSFTSSPDPDSRYIRFFFYDKVSGINVGLDDVSIAENTPTEQEINVQYQGADVPNGTAIQFATAIGNPYSIKLGIQNIGTVETLQLTGANLSGTASADYTVTTLPSTVAPASSDTLVVSFAPTTNGTRNAELSIANNDANENPYVIQLEGIGGTGASEPTTNPSSLSTSMLKTYRVKATFTPGDGSAHLVLISKNTPVSATIQDGLMYEVGQGVGNAKVAALGDIDHFWVKEATANDTFFVRVIGYNGSGAFTNYKQSDPLDTFLITPWKSSQLGDYYAPVDVQSSTFIADLHDVINPHMVRYYSNYGPDMVPRFIARDTVNEQEVLTGVYSADEVTYTPPFGWPETGMNREHTLPSSWMPSTGSSSTPEYQDYHHLFPTVATANSQRSNLPLGDVVSVNSSYGAGKRGPDVHGNTVYEPRDAQKGDAARAILYMVTAYHDPGSGDSWAFEDLLSNGPNQRLDVLLEWHLSDLPTGFEMARNDYLDSLQQNRNPFVDSVHWACYIDFRTMDYIAQPDSNCLQRAMKHYQAPTPVDTSDTTIGVADVQANDWLIYPNPSQGLVTVSQGSAQGAFTWELTDMLGRTVVSGRGSGCDMTIDLSGHRRGHYVLRIEGESGVKVKKRLILR